MTLPGVYGCEGEEGDQCSGRKSDPKNVSDIERGVAGITVSTLKRICEKLSVSSDWILFGDGGKNDLRYLTEKLERLPPEQFKAVESFLNQLLQLCAKLN